LLPRHGFHLRTHCPEDTEELSREFDALTRAIATHWFELSDDNILAWDIASLPKRFGGCGFVVSSPLRPFAYSDSLYNALHELGRNAPGTQRPKSQRDATDVMHEATIARLRSHPEAEIVKRLLEVNKMKGSGSWIDAADQWMPPDVYAAAWRLRCRAKAHSLPEGAKCPGCPTLPVMSQVDFANHAHGCAACPSGANATDAHNHLGKHVWKHCDANALHAELEPRGFESFTCSKCKEVLSGNDARVKLRQHDRRCGTKLYRRGVDLEVYVRGRRRMVDFTIAHPTCDSYLDSSLDAIARAKKAKKEDRYVKSGMVPQSELVVALAYSSGALHEDFMRFLGDVAHDSDTDFDALVVRTRNCVMWGQGKSVVAAFRTAAEAARRRVWTDA